MSDRTARQRGRATSGRPDLAEGRRLLAEAHEAAADGPAWAVPLRRDAAEHWLFDHADALLADAAALAALLPVVRECQDLLVDAAGRGADRLSLAAVRVVYRLDAVLASPRPPV